MPSSEPRRRGALRIWSRFSLGARESHRSRAADRELVLASGVFDQDWFEAQTGITYQSREDAVDAYLDAPGRSAHPLFIPQWLDAKFDAARAGQDPLVSYLRSPQARRFASPHPMVDSKALRTLDPDYENAPFGPLAAWLQDALPESWVPTGPGKPQIQLGDLVAASHEALVSWTRDTKYRRPQRTSRRPPPAYSAPGGGPAGVSLPSGDSALVSVVMPIWNCAQTVRRAIESVQAQTHARWELVVVDDGSSDDSVAVVRGIAEFDSRVTYIAAPHQGLSSARNLGLAAAEGRYVAFLDADKVWRPDFLRVMVGELHQHDWELAHSALRTVRDGDEYFSAFEGTHEHLLVENHVDLNVLVARTDAIRAVAGFDETLRGSGDYDLLLRLTKSSALHLVPYIGIDDTGGETASRSGDSERSAWLSVVASRHSTDWEEARARTRRDDLTSIVLPTTGSLRATLRWVNHFAGRTDVELVVVGTRLARWQYVALHSALCAAGNATLVGVEADRGAAHALNVGFAHASGARTVLAMGQVEPDEAGIDALAAALADPEVAVSQPVLVDRDGVIVSAGAVFGLSNARPEPFLHQHPLADADRVGAQPIPAALGALIAVRADVFADLEGLDPIFGDTLAPTDLSLRAYKRTRGSTQLRPDATFITDIPALPNDAELELALGFVDERHREPPPGSDLAWRAAGFDVVRRDLEIVGAQPDSVATPMLRPRTILRVVREHPPALRWAIDLPSPAGPAGLGWGDTYFGHGLAEALRRQGQHVAVDHRAARHRPTRSLDDVILVLRGLDRVLPRPECLNIEWVISHPDLVTAAEIGSFDLAYAASHSWSAEVTKEWEVEVRPLLQATDPILFHPGRAEFDSGDEVLFVGNSRGAHRPSLTAALATGANVTIHGQGWADVHPDEAISSRLVDNTELGGLYAGAGLVLNDHWQDMREKGFISNRLMDAAACGARIASDSVPGVDLGAFFHGLVRTFDGPDELSVLLAERDSAYPSTEARLQAAALVCAEHSFDQRASVLISDAVRAWQAKLA